MTEINSESVTVEPKYVEVVRYRGFESEGEAKKFLEEREKKIKEKLEVLRGEIDWLWHSVWCSHGCWKIPFPYKLGVDELYRILED